MRFITWRVADSALQLGPPIAKTPTVFDDARAGTYVDIEPVLGPYTHRRYGCRHGNWAPGQGPPRAGEVGTPLHTPYRLARILLPGAYADDGLISIHRHAFVDEPAFQGAYQRGVRVLGGQDFYQWQWRVHIGLRSAANASRLEGDFVECGVSCGFLSSAVMEFLDWDRLGKTFYMLDTFAGLDPLSVPVEN